MNILMLTDSMENGGAETHIYELSRSLCRLSHQVTVLSRGGAVAERLQAEGIRHINVKNLSARGGRLFSSLRAILEAVRKEKPTLIHAHTRQTVFLCHLLAPFLSVPVVFTAHAHFRTGGMGQLFRLFRGKTVAVSEDIARHLVSAFGRSYEDITVIGNGINTEYFAPVKEHQHEGIQILTISRLDNDCALAATLLCRLLPTLCKQFPVTLTVVGGGDALPALRALAAKTGVAVHFAGEKRDVKDALAQCDLFVGVSRAALEAMAMEKPVILCGNEGYLGILNENNMALAEQSNFCARGQALPSEAALMDDLVSLLQKSKEERADLGKRLRQAVLERHSATNMATATLGVYQSALRDHRTCDVLLCGYYGYGNLGDELVLRALVEGLTTRAPNIRLAALMGKGDPPVGVVPVYRRRPLVLLRTLKRTGILLLGGGTLLQSVTSRRSLYYYLSLMALARFFGVPYGILTGGVGPLANMADRRRCASLLDDASFLGLRDAGSLALLADMGIPPSRMHLGTDPVLTLPVPEKALSAKHLVVFPRKGDHKNESLLSGIARIAKQHQLPVYVAAMDKREDKDTALRLARALYRRGVIANPQPPLCLDRLCALLDDACLVMTRRLHALIMATAMGVPAVALSDDPKLFSFLFSVLGEEARELSLSPKELFEHKLARAAEFAIANRAHLTDKIANHLPALRQKAEQQLSLVVEKMPKS